jgi:hypothetical protein
MSKLNNFYPYAFSLDFFEGNHSQFVAGLTQQIQQVDTAHTVILFSYEWQPVDQIIRTINQIIQTCSHNIVWVLNDTFYLDNKQQLLNTGADVHFIEFDLLTLHFELNVYKTTTLNPQWNPDTGKFLFLTGKPNSSNRIRLLHKFYENNLLEHCAWSLFMDTRLRKSSRSLLPELSDQDFDKFVDTHINNPDKISVVYGSGGTCHYDGYPFDANMYTNTSFRVIPETQMFVQPIITEKTWITIANQQPFMIAGYQNNLSHLKKLGYRTFENYLKIGNYDTIENTEDRLNAVVENTQNWLNFLHVDQEQIAQDVKHNYELLMSQMNKTATTFNSIYRKLGSVNYHNFMIVPVTMQRSKWINFYYGIKDPQWPDCFSEKDFNSLPAEVQKECIEVYGYNATELI